MKRKIILTKEELEELYKIHGQGKDMCTFLYEIHNSSMRELFYIKKEVVYDFLGLNCPCDHEVVQKPEPPLPIIMKFHEEKIKEPESFKGKTMVFSSQPSLKESELIILFVFLFIGFILGMMAR